MTSPLGTGPFVPHGTARGRKTASDVSGIDRIETTLARVPDCPEGLASRLGEIVFSDEFAWCTTEIRRTAEASAWYAVSLTNHIDWLTANGFTREDARQVRYLAEVVHSREPAIALTAAVVLRLLGGTWLASYRLRSGAQFLVDWPEYRQRVRDEIWVSVQTCEYEPAMLALSGRVWELSEMVLVEPLEVDCATAAAYLMECIGESCEDMIVACALRRMFIRAETAGRRTP